MDVSDSHSLITGRETAGYEFANKSQIFWPTSKQLQGESSCPAPYFDSQKPS